MGSLDGAKKTPKASPPQVVQIKSDSGSGGSGAPERTLGVDNPVTYMQTMNV